MVDDSDVTGGVQEGLDGVLRIEESCVVAETTTGFEVTLVWPESRTEWDAGGSIRFRSSEGSLEPDDGTEVSVGGGDAAGSDFVAAPAESCPDERFLVSDVRAGG